MTKRGPEDLQLALNGALFANVMTADSEPKKAKLDPTALYSQFYAAQMNGLANASTAHYLAGAPLTQMPALACSASSSTTAATSATTSVLQTQPRSKVVHVRNIPPDMVDVELIQLCVPYGPISNYMMLKGKSQAFVEYEDESGAVGFVTSMTAMPIQIRGRTIFAQYSTHQELKLDKSKSLADADKLLTGLRSVVVNHRNRNTDANNSHLMCLGSSAVAAGDTSAYNHVRRVALHCSTPDTDAYGRTLSFQISFPFSILICFRYDGRLLSEKTSCMTGSTELATTRQITLLL
ncbi:unnamed protein product [Caenorhabditis auriculariae]|uniref:RRM domain-containing protein n=1 Tax=Caenorhabditis auriculariae TaxID=2777116 RepID=A0A8S1HKM5_9PELO|nr:unnamed protein product [Caenorhabditis auriculariae]